MQDDAQIKIVIPCYNEADRLDVDGLRDFARSHPNVDFILVNDGSLDATLGVLQTLADESPSRFKVIDQQPNAGKAAAVQRGMIDAMRGRVTYAGYWDADMATPLSELPRFLEVLASRSDCDMVFGARVQMLGHSIQRSPVRHYVGRVFATVVSIMLRLPIYDTQCGAKVFRVTPDMTRLFAFPFVTRWTFDVEIIARLSRLSRDEGRPSPQECIRELPLTQWHDVAGSNVRLTDFLPALRDLSRIYRRYLSSSATPLPALPASDELSDVTRGRLDP